MNKYKQITLSDRYTIYHERKQGKSCAEIADIIGKHRSTADRELKRNKCPSHGHYVVENLMLIRAQDALVRVNICTTVMMTFNLFVNY